MRVCVCVHALKGKRLELSTENLVHIYCMVVARHALTKRSKVQRSGSHDDENRLVRMTASGCCSHCTAAGRRGTARRTRMIAKLSSVDIE